MATMTAHAINDPKFNDKPLCETTLADQVLLRRIWVQFPDVDAIACDGCRQRLTNRPSGPKRNLLEEIKAGMLQRNPRIADPEWATESYR